MTQSPKASNPAVHPIALPTVRLAHVAHFSAGHRYARGDRSEAENKALYGDLMQPAGYGHNFRIEAHFEGPIHPETGSIEKLSKIDDWLKAVTGLLDHRFLNRDVEFFRFEPPTIENIARFCFEQIEAKMKASSTTARLFKVRAFEGDATWVDHFRTDATQEERDL